MAFDGTWCMVFDGEFVGASTFCHVMAQACTLALLRDGYAVVAVDTNKDK
eukprot:gene11237-304_t